jgi:hypothetical protein
VKLFFSADPSVRSVGITRHGAAFGYHVVRNRQLLAPLGVRAEMTLLDEINGVAVKFTDAPGEVESLVIVPAAGPASPTSFSLVPEVQRHRHLVCGLQIQNFDDDVRQGVTAQSLLEVGTLGCFVRLANGAAALLSNNHIVAGENRGVRGGDRILQPGARSFTAADQIAVLSDFVVLQASPPGASPGNGRALFNDVDAGVAELDQQLIWKQGYLAARNLPALSGAASAQLGGQVFKVGRSTGLTRGEVVDIGVTVGPVPYSFGHCWFQDSFTVEGLAGTMFSDKGDSGAAIVNAQGEVLGLLYAGNGQQTYACPIDKVLLALNCVLA